MYGLAFRPLLKLFGLLVNTDMEEGGQGCCVVRTSESKSVLLTVFLKTQFCSVKPEMLNEFLFISEHLLQICSLWLCKEHLL